MKTATVMRPTRAFLLLQMTRHHDSGFSAIADLFDGLRLVRVHPPP